MIVTAIVKKMLLIFIGICAALFFLETGMRFAEKFFLFQQYQSNLAALRQAEAIRVLCLGESTTAIGGEDSYPSQLQSVLSERFPGKAFTVLNKGIPACTTDDR